MIPTTFERCGMKELIKIVSNEPSQLGRFEQTEPKEGNIQVPMLGHFVCSSV